MGAEAARALNGKKYKKRKRKLKCKSLNSSFKIETDPEQKWREE